MALKQNFFVKKLKQLIQLSSEVFNGARSEGWSVEQLKNYRIKPINF